MGLVALINFGLMLISAQFLGAHGRGLIASTLLYATIFLAVSEFIGGAALVYLVPRKNLKQLLMPSFVWAIGSSLILNWLFIPPALASTLSHHWLGFSLAINLFSIVNNVLIGQQKIKDSNRMLIIQAICSISLVAIFMNRPDTCTALHYIDACTIAYTIAFVYGIVRITYRSSVSSETYSGWDTFKTMVRYGFLTQLSNSTQLLNYRLSYFLIQYYHNLDTFGIYATGVALCEATWIIGNGISKVQYAMVANSPDKAKMERFSIQLSWASFVLTTLALIVLIFLPSSFYSFLFGPEFTTVKMFIAYLAIGIAGISFSTLYAHYFSGTGKVWINTVASLIGLVITIAAGFLLIPTLGMKGAALTATLSYLSSSIFIVWQFTIHSGTPARQLLPRKNDIRLLLSSLFK